MRRLREQDVARALARKLPKVVADARGRGGQSLLALEVSDLALGGLTTVFKIASRLLGPDADLDWLVVVDTVIDVRDFCMALEEETGSPVGAMSAEEFQRAVEERLDLERFELES